jgi:predicted nucleic acid-binding protein
VDFNRAAWQSTEQLAWNLDRAGKFLPLPELIIAVCALRVDADILTGDPHFRLGPGMRLAQW